MEFSTFGSDPPPVEVEKYKVFLYFGKNVFLPLKIPENFKKIFKNVKLAFGQAQFCLH